MAAGESMPKGITVDCGEDICIPERHVKFLDKDGKLHSDHGPALIIIDCDGPDLIFYGQTYPGVLELHYMKHGIYHRIGGPAIIKFGMLKTPREYYYFINGKLHRKDGPALMLLGSFGRDEYHIHGKLHREDGPAVIEYGLCTKFRHDISSQKYYIDGKFVRDGGRCSIKKSHYKK